MASHLSKKDADVIAALDPRRLQGISSIEEEIDAVISGKSPVRLTARDKKWQKQAHNPFLAPREELKNRAEVPRLDPWMFERRVRVAAEPKGPRIAAFGGGGGGGIPALKDVDPAAYRDKLLESIADRAAMLGLDLERYYAKVRERLRPRKDVPEGMPAELVPPGPPPPAKVEDADIEVIERVERMSYRDLKKARGR